MNFKKLKKLAILAVAPLILASGNHIVFAGGGASTMRKSSTLASRQARGGRLVMCPVRDDYETHYEVHDISATTPERAVESHVDSSERHYETYDMSRIVYETFNYTKRGYYDDNLFGPWRFMAYKRVEHNPKFESLIPEETARQVELENRLRRIEASFCWDGTGAPPPHPEFIPITADDADFKYNYTLPTENKEFEKVVESCRREWNLVHDYKEPIASPEEALKKALRILKPAFEDKDPFCNKPVKVSYDPVKRIYQLKPISKYAISETHVDSILLGANGDVISIDLHGAEDLLRRLV